MAPESSEEQQLRADRDQLDPQTTHPADNVKAEEGPGEERADESHAAATGVDPQEDTTATIEDETGSNLTRVSLSEETCAPSSSASCDDLERGQAQVQRPPALTSVRFYIMLLALVSPFIVTYSKTIINFAIIDMIDPSYLRQNANNHHHHHHNSLQTTNATLAGTEAEAALSYFDMDNSCPVEESVRARLLSELASDERRATETRGEKFQWDTDKQGYLKAAYSIGHALLQVAGGRLSEIYGSQFIMSLCACLIAFCCLSAPFLASVHFYLLFADLLMLGVFGSFMTPSLITLISNWLTPSEKSLMMSFYLVSSRLGYAISSLLCGLLIDAQLSWRYLFYSAGWVSFAFGNLFYICSRNRPQEHPLMSQAELEYLATKNKLVREALASQKMARLEQTEMKPFAAGRKTGRDEAEVTQASPAEKKPPTAAPWFAILTNAPVWAFIITKFCVKLMGDTVQTELPVYLKRVMHMESKYNGYINSSNYVIFCVSCVGVGTLAKWASKRRPFGLTKTTVRKLFQCTASFGVSLVLLGVSVNVCNETATLGLFMVMFFITTFSTGGEAQLPLDLSERYAGTIHALGSTLAISGALEPIFVGQFLLGHGADRSRWSNIWMGASAISFLGGLIFLILGEAKIQPFDEIGTDTKPEKPTGQANDKPKAANGFIKTEALKEQAQTKSVRQKR